MVRYSALAVLTIFCVPLSPVFGQQAGCVTKGAAICGAGAAPSLVSGTSGDVKVSHGGDFKPAGAHQALRAGDRILLESQGANLALGPSCSAPLRPGSLVTISRKGNLNCMTEAEPYKAQANRNGDNLPLGGVTPEQIGIGAGLAGVIAIPVIILTVSTQ